MIKLKTFIKEKPLQFVYLILSLLILKELIYIQTFSGDVSPIADGFSEANAIRGATGFYEKGITSFNGLPEICYGEQLKHRGYLKSASEKGEICKGKAYTHYPPGPEYITWLGFKVIGSNNWVWLRLLPILLSAISGFIFINCIFSIAGSPRQGLILSLMLILPPMFSNYMHGLHYQQYAFILFQLQVSLAISFFTKANSQKIFSLITFAVMAFIQGWLSFDFAFIATLFSIPFYFYFKEEFKLKFKQFFVIPLVSGLGFTLAHLLHFYQVVLYWGELDLALKDFTGSAKERASHEVSSLSVVKDFLYRVSGRGKYLAINLMNFIWIIFGLKLIKRIEFKKGWIFEFDIRKNDLISLFSAIVISSMWSLIMKHHAFFHGFIARHYYFAYFFCCLILITRTRKVES